MLVESMKYPAKELPCILSRKATAPQLQKSRERTNRRRGTHRSLADGDGAAAVSLRGKIQSPRDAAGRRSGGGVVDDAAERRQAVTPACGSVTAAELSPSGNGGEAQGAGEQRRKKALWGVKE
jgi:hypothetical protein